MLSNSVCNHTPAFSRLSDFVNHLYDYRLNWTPLSPITIINWLVFRHVLTFCPSEVFLAGLWISLTDRLSQHVFNSWLLLASL